jgi:DNA-binding response OmpR family regulator
MSADNGKRSRLLLIEDEERIAQFLVKGLTPEGYDIVVAEDGEVALFLAATEHFDAVILDLGLPGIPGIEVLEQIHHRHPSVPVIMLTGHDEPLARWRCLSAGASGFVTKPLNFTEFRSVLRNHLAVAKGRD